MSISYSEKIVEVLKSVIGDATQPISERERAALALRWYVAKEQGCLDAGDSQGTATFVARASTYMLWKHPEDEVVVPVKGEDGVERLVWQRVNKNQEIPEPSVPISNFTPAILFPVLSPGDEERAAVREMAERFKPAKTKERVAAIDAGAPRTEAARTKTTVGYVAQIEQEMAAREDLQLRIAANERELARLKSLRDSQIVQSPVGSSSI